MNYLEKYAVIKSYQNLLQKEELLKSANEEQFLVNAVDRNLPLDSRVWIYDTTLEHPVGFHTPIKATKQANTYQIGAVYIHPEHRGKGLAKKALEEFTRDKNAFAFINRYNKASHRLFESLGFTKGAALKHPEYGDGNWYSKKQSILETLLKAKEYSDQKKYKDKGVLLNRLMMESPEDFEIDESSIKGKNPGLRHVPTGFQYHLPRKYIPSEVQYS